MVRPRNIRAMGFEEAFTFSVQLGHVVDVTISVISNRPPRSNFRPIVALVEFSPSYTPATSSTPGYYSPGALQFSWCDCSSSVAIANSTTGVVTATSGARRVSLRYPRSADWFDWDLAGASIVATINNVCIGAPGPSTATSYIRGTVRMRFRVGAEVIAPSCPAIHLSGGTEVIRRWGAYSEAGLGVVGGNTEAEPEVVAYDIICWYTVVGLLTVLSFGMSLMIFLL